MENTEQLLALAEIAGVFVGFGALISVRSGGPSDAYEVTLIRSVLSFGIWVMVAGLFPLVISGYVDARDAYELWPVCGLLALVVFWGTLAVGARTPENRAGLAAATLADYRFALVGFWPFVIVISAALVVVVLDLWREPALYLTAVVAGLFAAGATLFMLVFAQGREQAADRTEQPAE